MNLIICPRCKREVMGWPLWRPDLCSPKDWAKCIRNETDVILQLERIEQKRLAKKVKRT